jgi:hypothetical protein
MQTCIQVRVSLTPLNSVLAGGQHEPPRSEPTAAPVTWDEYVSGAPADAGTVERHGCSEELTSLDDERL